MEIRTRELNDIARKVKKTISVKEMTLPEALRQNGYDVNGAHMSKAQQNEYEKLRTILEDDDEILTHGDKRGRLYFTNQTPAFLTIEQKVDMVYATLRNSEVELTWKEILELTGLSAKSSAAIQRRLRLKPDVIRGSKRQFWAIDGLHEEETPFPFEIIEKPNTRNIIPKSKLEEILEAEWCFCPHCGEKLK